MKKDELRFIEEGHQYFLGDTRLFSVTQHLSLAFGDPWADLPPASRDYALELGREVHNWTAHLDMGGSQQPSSEQMKGYIKAWSKWKKDMDAELVAVEEMVFSRKLQYAGKLDRIVKIGGELAVVDLKTGGDLHIFTSFQTEAYRLAWEEMSHPKKIKRRFGVRLGADGIPHPEEYTLKTDRNVWLAALTIVGQKLKHKICLPDKMTEGFETSN